MTREELLSIFSENANVIGMKLIQYSSPALAQPLRMAILQVERWTDTSRVAVRFIWDGKLRANFYLLTNCDSLCQKILERPLSIQASVNYDSDLSSESFIRELKQCGDIEFVGERFSEEGSVLNFQANCNFSYGNLTRSRSMRLGEDSISIDTIDEFLSDPEFFGLLPHVQPKYNRSSQDTGLVKKTDSYSSRIKASLLPTVDSYSSFEPLFKDDITSINDDLSFSEDEDNQIEFPRLEYDERNVGNSSFFSFFCERSVSIKRKDDLQVQIPSVVATESPTIEVGQVPLVLHDTKGSALALSDQVFTNPEVQNIIRSRPKPAKKELSKEQEKKTLQKYQENTLEILAKLAKLGIDVNKEFLESLLLRVDPSTTPQELPKSFLKIVKTKFRKLKRREKKKTGKKGQAQSESEEADSDDEDNIQNGKGGMKVETQKDNQYALNSGDPGVYPESWLNFVASLQPVELDQDENPSEDLKKLELRVEPAPDTSGIPNHNMTEVTTNIPRQAETISSLLHLIDQLDTSLENYRLNPITEEEKLRILSKFERRLQHLQQQQ